MEKFKSSILNGNYEDAFEIAEKMKRKEICEALIEISFDTRNLLAYGFIVYALLKNETPRYHWIARALLTTSYIDLEGSAELAFCHAKRSMEIDETSFDSLSGMLGMSEHPDTSGTLEDYVLIKQKISKLYPGDPILKGNYKEHKMNQEDISKSKMSEWDYD